MKSKVIAEHLLETPASLTLFFADDAVLLAKSLIMVMLLELLHEEPKALELKVS